jgi:hypothetical protein
VCTVFSVGLNGAPFHSDYAIAKWTDTSTSALPSLKYIGFTAGKSGITSHFNPLQANFCSDFLCVTCCVLEGSFSDPNGFIVDPDPQGKSCKARSETCVYFWVLLDCSSKIRFSGERQKSQPSSHLCMLKMFNYPIKEWLYNNMN